MRLCLTTMQNILQRESIDNQLHQDATEAKQVSRLAFQGGFIMNTCRLREVFHGACQLSQVMPREWR